MSHAYTPGLRVTGYTTLRRERRLPLRGQVLVAEGAPVRAEAVVARTELPGNVHPVNVANLLNVLPEEVEKCLLKPPGSTVADGEEIAVSSGLFGLFKSRCHSPVAGVMETVSRVTGQVMVREAPIRVEVNAYVDGTVMAVAPEEGVTVETAGSLVQGIFGIGGETWGEIRVMADDPSAVLERDGITPDLAGKVIVGGALVTGEALAAAARAGVRAVVAGGIHDQDLRTFLGYELGVAITGAEDRGITLVLTEGFGRLRMAARTFELLQACEGKRASVSGATQIRAGVNRPEVIVPLAAAPAGAASGVSGETGLAEGCAVRVIREPFFGRLGTVVALPPELEPLETEARVRVLTVAFTDGTRQTLPRANVEMIEG
jgi:hypothetical protein